MKQTIFFLENDPEFRERAVAVLRQEYEVLTAEGVREGWNVLEKDKERIKLLLLDIMMTTDEMFDVAASQGGLLSGVLFYEKVKEKIYNNQNMPTVVFVTALKVVPIEKFPPNYNLISKHYMGANLNELLGKINVILKG